MISTQPRLWRVMISSTMVDMQEIRQAVAQTITDTGMEPLYADRRPNEYTESNKQLSYGMAEQCDLYLLIIKDRYGSLDKNTRRSITHEEFLIARKTPRKVRVFIHRDARAVAESHHDAKFQAFLDEVMDFKSGVPWSEFTDLSSLLAEIQHTITTFRDDGQGARLAYARWVIETLGEFKNPVTGVTSSYDATVMLKLRTEEQRVERSRMEKMAEEERRGRHRKDEQRTLEETVKPIIALAGEFLEKYERLVVIGDVGAGKSTLLRRIAYDMAQAYLTDPTQTRLPVVLRTIDLGKMARQQTNRSLADIAGMVKEHEVQDPAVRQQIRYAVAEAIDQSNALLLIDSLDEAPAVDQSATLALLSTIGKNRAILASRPAASPGGLSGWRICDIQRLDATQRRELMTNVMHAVLLEDSVMPDPTQLENVLQQRQSDLFDWAGNPLLLTLVTTQFARDRKLPESRARIYRIAIEDLQRQRDASGNRWLSMPELNELLSHLALAMTKEITRTTTVEEVATKYLKEDIQRLYPGVSPEKIAQELLDRSGVLGKELDQYEWIHLSFREYLTAVAISSYQSATLHSVIQSYCLNDQWEQVWQLLASIFDTDAQPQKADQVIEMLVTLDPVYIRALKQHDPLHIALSVATRCYFARPEQLRSSYITKKLRRKWMHLFRGEFRKQLAGAEYIVGESLNPSYRLDGYRLFEFEDVPKYLIEGTPFVFGQLFPQRNWDNSRWIWVIPLLASILLLLLLALISQTTFLVPSLARSGWGEFVNTWLPTSVFLLMGALLFARLIGIRDWCTESRRTWLSELMSHLKITTISQIGIEKLILALDGSNWGVKLRASMALRQLGEPVPMDGIEKLFLLVGDSNLYVRHEAAITLGQLVTREACLSTIIERLVLALEDPNSDMRDGAALALRQLDELVPMAGIEKLVQLLSNSSSGVRNDVAHVLGYLVHSQETFSWMDK